MMRKRLLAMICISMLALGTTPAVYADNASSTSTASEESKEETSESGEGKSDSAKETDVSADDSDKSANNSKESDGELTENSDDTVESTDEQDDTSTETGELVENSEETEAAAEEENLHSDEGSLSRPDNFTDQEETGGELEEYVEAEEGSVDGNEVVKYIYRSLRDYFGFNHAAACAVIANARHESNFNYTVVGDGGTSYGIFQWHAGRWNNLKAWCAENNYDWQNADGQMAYFRNELETGYKDVLDYLLALEDSDVGAFDGAYYMCVHFEKPADTYGQANSRGKEAIEFFGMEELRNSYRASIAESDESKSPWDLVNY
ncbi:MAG: hypothetical protein IJ123_02335 [Blautia sp.]|nr:hypothetical protein [Blautia sp.]